MKAVQPKEIVDALYDANYATYQRMKKAGHRGAAIDFPQFEAVMLRSGILTDPATIRAKWRTLLSLGVIKLAKPDVTYGKAAVDFEVFEVFHIIPVLPSTQGEIDREIERDMCKVGEGL